MNEIDLVLILFWVYAAVAARIVTRPDPLDTLNAE